ncbi:acyl-CoA synthetase [Zhengella mangrovi]|uniref:Acyl-CoA synthetase n=1 Tax=Zhengella mangrovi TaxID=1982044 RepID=A0A2G1QIH9_9HYPH|nr:acyl-CoA synthetase [Zhengella mangrovi]PHP65260.1 acyl-CoA synthetase [Zhengella mangrovi]
MAGVHVLDRVIGDTWPSFATDAELEAFEAVPYEDRIAASSTYEALKVGAAVNPDEPAILFLPNANPDEEPVRMTHGQFIERVTQVANALHALGVGPTDVVSLLLPLIPQSFYALQGAQAAGIANPVNPFLEPDQIAHILRAAGTKVLIAMGPSEGFDTWDKVMKIRDQLPDLKAILVFEPWGAAPEGTVSFNSAVRAQPGDRLISGRQIRSTDVAAYFHTGGTTGLPQLVPLTHGNLVYQAWGMALMFRTRPGARLFMALPLFHVGGALTHCLQQLSSGGTLVVLSSGGWRNKNAMPKVWKLVDRFRPEVLAAVPTVIGAVLNTPIDGADVSSIRTVTGGGSAIPVAVAEAYKNRFNLQILETYGMTEASSCHTISYADRPVYLGSVGRALPYSRVRVVELDANGKAVKDCPPGEIGVVAMSGPGVFSGYVTGSSDAPFVAPGWVNSGDLGRLDANGYLWITGRAKDLIIRGGHNIDPRGVEEVIYDHPAVQEVALVGEPDAYAGELPVAFVQLKAGAKANPAELKEWTAARTPERAALPVHIYILDRIPLTAVGKVFKPDLRYEAAKRAVLRMIAPVLEGHGCEAEVKVGAHPAFGTLISVRLSGPAEAKDGAVGAVKAKLEPLTVRHDIEWNA